MIVGVVHDSMEHLQDCVQWWCKGKGAAVRHLNELVDFDLRWRKRTALIVEKKIGEKIVENLKEILLSYIGVNAAYEGQKIEPDIQERRQFAA